MISLNTPPYPSVAPYTGAWIEICMRGTGRRLVLVAPYTGAWIEIKAKDLLSISGAGRTLHGCVD